MEYIRNAIPVLIDLLGDDDALAIGKLCGRQIGMQCYDELVGRLGIRGEDITSYLDLLETLLRASGDEVSRDGDRIQRSVWRFGGAEARDPLFDAIWRAPFEGLLAVHNRFLEFKSNVANEFVVGTC